MFAPRFTIRTILIIITGFAFYFLLAGLGVRGHAWAGAIAIGVGSLAVVTLVHASLFALCWIMAGGSRWKDEPVVWLRAGQISNDVPETPNEEAGHDVS